MQLIDSFGRTINYVRLSVTDRCDLRCVYCMAENMTFLPRAEVLSIEELATLGETFVGLGVTKLRITGGEPLVRRGTIDLLERLGKLSGDEGSEVPGSSSGAEPGPARAGANVMGLASSPGFPRGGSGGPASEGD